MNLEWLYDWLDIRYGVYSNDVRIELIHEEQIILHIMRANSPACRDTFTRNVLVNFMNTPGDDINSYSIFRSDLVDVERMMITHNFLDNKNTIKPGSIFKSESSSDILILADLSTRNFGLVSLMNGKLVCERLVLSSFLLQEDIDLMTSGAIEYKKISNSLGDYISDKKKQLNESNKKKIKIIHK